MAETIGKKQDMTVEFYDDPLGVKMVAALYIPANRLAQYVQQVGKLLCRIRKRNTLEAAIYKPDGELADKITVYR